VKTHHTQTNTQKTTSSDALTTNRSFQLGFSVFRTTLVSFFKTTESASRTSILTYGSLRPLGSAKRKPKEEQEKKKKFKIQKPLLAKLKPRWIDNTQSIKSFEQHPVPT
jgi:hypothetical protein